MEFAIGIAFVGNEIAAYAVNPEGQTSALPLKEIFKRGLPTCERPIRRRIDTNFADWAEVDGRAYLDAFGFAECPVSDVNHQFFDVKKDGRTYIVPALALMRAIFRPTRDLLPVMFLPNAIDRTCRLSFEGEVASVIVDARWAYRSLATKTTDWVPRFGWMLAHPTAFRMAGSVHREATRGRISLQLPEASVRMVFKGKEFGRTMFVTEASVTALTPSDIPDFSVSGLSSVVTFHERNSQVGGREPSSASRHTVPNHHDGGFNLSDAEWTKIEPLLLARRMDKGKIKHSPRLILDGILHKLGTGCHWKQVEYAAGNWQNASARFQQLDANGVLAAIVVVLSETRVRYPDDESQERTSLP